MSKQIWNIVAHQTDPILAAMYWKRNNFCAFATIKYSQFDKSDYDCKNFLAISEGDLVFLYVKHKTIAYIGEVVSNKIKYVNKNIPSYIYHNRKQVKWWDEPRFIKLEEFPTWLAKQIPKPHRSVSPVEYPGHTFSQVVSILKNVKSTSGLDSLPEKIINTNMRKMLRLISNDLEEDLTIAEAETSTSGGDIPDFIAVDKDEKIVIIECKATVKMEDLDQLQRYSDNYGMDHRLMLVAYSFPSECIIEAHKRGIECYECSMKFTKL